MITDVTKSKIIENHYLFERFTQSKITKYMYSYKHKANINKIIKFELKIIVEVMSHPTRYKMETPIAHLVHREPECITYDDTYLEVGSGFSEVFFGGMLKS